MTILDVIRQVDGLIHNTYTQEEKVQWLSFVDTAVKEQIIDPLEGPTQSRFEGYHSETPLDTELLIPEPYGALYLHWLEAQIHYYNGEYGRYNQAYAMYSAAMKAYANHYNRTHVARDTHYRYF